MKKLSIILIIFFLFFIPNNILAKERSFKFYICGVDLDIFNNINKQSILQIITGAVSSIIVHEIGHTLYLQSINKEIHFYYNCYSFYTDTNDNLTDKQYINFNRSGFLFQTTVSTILINSQFNKSYFTKGFISFQNIELSTYNLRHYKDGDFYNIDCYGGNTNRDWILLNTISQYNLLRLNN